MNNKNILIILIALAVAGGLYWYSMGDKSIQDVTNYPESERVQSNTDSQVPEGKIAAGVFSGKLEEVNTGCFADGECFVVVDGKHVTTTIGWSQDIVGTVQGVPSFGDLESHIGDEVEVYARKNADGTYSLYGSEGFYVKLK